jgi:hypothetical protein
VALEVDEVEQEQPLELEALVQDQQVQVDNLEEVDHLQVREAEVNKAKLLEAVAVGHHLAVDQQDVLLKALLFKWLMVLQKKLQVFKLVKKLKVELSKLKWSLCHKTFTITKMY